jgi:hypothetical protein
MWTGRTLTKHEREVINTPERSRRCTTIKVHIIDNPGTNSKPILVEYMRYLQELYPYRTGAILDKTKKSACAIARTMPRRTLFSSVQRPNYLRGANYDICMIFNPPPNKISELIRTTGPPICDNRPGCALIILSTPDVGSAASDTSHPSCPTSTVNSSPTTTIAPAHSYTTSPSSK